MTEAVNNASLLRTTTYSYDDLNRLTDQTESTNVAATKRQTTFSYDAASRLVDTTFVANTTTFKQETTYSYDALDRMTGMTEAANGGALKRLTTYGYDNNDNLTSVADVLNRLSTYTYDARNRLTKVTQPDPDGGGPLTSPITQYSYDENNNVVSVTNARNNITTYSYDPFNELQQIKQASPDGVAASPLTTFSYDATGNLTTVADPNNHVTTYNYDNLNRVVSEVGPVPGGGAGSSVVQYNYDQAGTVAQVIESPGLPIQNIATYSYDNLDRVLTDSETVQLTGNTTTTAIHTYAYDTLGRLQSKVDADSRLVTYAYDALDRLTNEKWYSGPTTGSTLQRTITYAYDLRDNLTDDNEGATNVRSTFTYDLLDRVTDETQVIPQASGSVTFTYRTTFSYFADDQVQSRRALINGTLNSTTTYSYDGMGRLSDEKETLNPSGNGNKEAAFSYLPTGQIQTIQRKGGLSFVNAALTTYSYDNMERVTSISTIQGAFSYQYTYAYDAASRITGETNPSGTVTYTYYDNDQIKTATYSYRSAESFSWDENGNPTGGGIVIGAGDRLINDGTSTYEYDAEGNRSKKSTGTTVSTYSWDQRERLTGMTTKVSGTTNKLVTVSYDAFNRRIAEYAGNGSTVSRRDHYFWDGDQVHTIANGTSSPTVTDRFLMGPRTDNVIDDEKAGTNDWTLTDVRGDVQEVVDSTGNSLTKKDYSAFGVKSDTGNPSVVDTIFAYTGRENDPDLGLQYNRNRWYDAAAKRFISADHILDDFNTYRYVRNNPVNGTDPSGLEGPGSGNAEADKALNELGRLELKRIREGLTPFEQIVWRSLRDYARDLLDIPHYEITPPPPEKGVCRQLWDATKEGVWEGMGNVSDATLQMGEGILNTVQHPVDTIGGLAKQFGEGVQMLWNDPLGTLGNAWNNITKDPSKSLAQFGVNVLFMFGSMVGKGAPPVPAAEAKPPFGGSAVATVEGDSSLAGTAAFPPPDVMPPGPFNGCQTQLPSGIPAKGPKIHSRYADSTPVYEGQQPPRIKGPDLAAGGNPHTVLRPDSVNGRIYQGREFGEGNVPVRDVDMTNPTYPNGTPRPGHPGPPHQHPWIPNDPLNPRAGHRRGGPEPIQ
jgi:RHS repeat-associated protein